VPLLLHVGRGVWFIDFNANRQGDIVVVLQEDGAERCARGDGVDWVDVDIGVEATMIPEE
jgi:hypothetical protein